MSFANTYGIEIEYEHPQSHNDKLAKKLHKAGIKNIDLTYDCSVTAPLNSSEPRYCSCGCGTELDGGDYDDGTELVTGIIRGQKRLESFSRKISAFNRKEGMKFNVGDINDITGSKAAVNEMYGEETDTGLHIHFGIKLDKVTGSDIVRLFENLIKYEDRLIALSGRNPNKYCKPVSNNYKTQLKYIKNEENFSTFLSFIHDRYYGVNLENILDVNTKKHTIEFRYAHASLTRSHTRFMRYFNLCKKIVEMSFTGRKMHNGIKYEFCDYAGRLTTPRNNTRRGVKKIT